VDQKRYEQKDKCKGLRERGSVKSISPEHCWNPRGDKITDEGRRRERSLTGGREFLYLRGSPWSRSLASVD